MLWIFFNFDLCIIERAIIKSKDFFLNGSMFMEDCNKKILKIGEINCIITFKILI